MVVGSQSSARSAWQAVTAKVVLANRLRKGLGGGKDLRIEAFKVEELGGRAGQSVFGPVSTFNGGLLMTSQRWALEGRRERGREGG